jgi:hypothetical protein
MVKRILIIVTAVAGALGLLAYALRRWLVAWGLHLSPPRHRVHVERDLRIPARDGVVLMADCWSPSTLPPYPTILIRTPYGRNAATGAFGWLTAFCARRFAERGYAVLVQDVRGRFGSGGVFEPFIHEREDGQDTLDWLRAQPWCGRIGMWGSSYLGIVQWSVADDQAIAALMPGITTSDVYDVIFPDGAFDLGLAIRWISLLRGQYRYLSRPWLAGKILWDAELDLRRASRRMPISAADAAMKGGAETYYGDWMRESLRDHALRERFTYRVHKRVGAPVHLMSGWYDFFLRGTLRDYAALTAEGHTPHLTVGPWAHFSHIFLMLEMLAPGVRWFDAHLRGLGQPRRLPVRLYVMGLNQWREYPAFPPPSTPQTWYLGSGGRLNEWAEDAPVDHLHYDPSHPTPIRGGNQFAPLAGVVDNRRWERREDVLSYTSSLLDRPLEIIGAPQLRLNVRTSSPDADIYVRLCDVHPDGRSLNVCDGFLRCTAETGDCLPDGSRLIALDLWSTAYRFARGHRLRLTLAGGAHPRWSRHTGTHNPFTDTSLCPVDYTIFHDGAHVSMLTLPVTDGGGSELSTADARRSSKEDAVAQFAEADDLGRGRQPRRD